MSRAPGRSDVQAGLVFVLFGALALGLGPSDKGTASEMAAGYLPTLLGVLLIAVGLMLAAHGVRAARRERAPPSDLAAPLDHAPASGQTVHFDRVPASGRAASGTASRLASLRPFLILPAIIAFGLLLENVGLVIASVALLAIGALAARDLTVRQFAVLAIVLLVMVLAVFVWGLGLPVKVWPSAASP
jgi:putative tricarboxylic transport membrane protein